MIVRYLLDCEYIRRMVADSASRAEVLSWLLHLRSALQQNAYLLVDERGENLNDLVETVKDLNKEEEEKRGDVSSTLLQLRGLLNDLLPMIRRSVPVPKDLPNFDEFVRHCVGLNRPDGIITDNREITKRSRGDKPEVLTISSFPTSAVEKTRRAWIGKQTFDGKNKTEFIEYVKSFARGSQSIEIMDKLIWRSGREDYIKSIGYWLCLFVCAGVQRITVVSNYSDQIDLSKVLGSLEDEIKSATLPCRNAKLDLIIDTKKEDNEVFHDRFAISDTHYFAVGRGFDVMKLNANRSFQWRIFNSYFCGRRQGAPGSEDIDSKDITMIRNLPSQRPSSETLKDPVEMIDSEGKKITVAVSFVPDF